MSDKNINHPAVMIIDDDEVNRKVLHKIFEKQGIKAFLAESGKKGVAMVENNKPDIILLDIFMPGENGFEILASLKNDPELKDIPVCIFSILEDEEKIKKAYKMGACAYITKPFDMKETVIQVQKILKECLPI